MKLKTLFRKDSLQENTYIITENNKALIIDPGCDYEDLNSYLDNNDIKEVSIFLTHTHHDHIRIIAPIVEKYNSIIYLSEKEMVIFETEMPKYADSKQLKQINKNLIFIKDKIIFNNNEYKVLEVPGHTVGHLMLEIPELQAYFSGDFIFNNDIGYTQFFTGSSLDMKNSLDKIQTLNKEYVIYPGHGPETTVENELTNNFYINNPIEKW
ncbi:MBL fold metallo-hydrolase [Mycoplasma sp. P36-A1]|uniref:MBL fold metallo-hydrolase n=1 Tax=Mycoplasma sp. P36-A1 TaxID=3252900 RepID=UPI003C3024F0